MEATVWLSKSLSGSPLYPHTFICMCSSQRINGLVQGPWSLLYHWLWALAGTLPGHLLFQNIFIASKRNCVPIPFPSSEPRNHQCHFCLRIVLYENFPSVDCFVPVLLPLAQSFPGSSTPSHRFYQHLISSCWAILSWMQLHMQCMWPFGLFWPRNCNEFVYKFLYRHVFCFLRCISKIAESKANYTSLTVTTPHAAARSLLLLTTECPCPSQRQPLGTRGTRSSSFHKVYYKHDLIQKQITLPFSGLGTVF